MISPVPPLPPNHAFGVHRGPLISFPFPVPLSERIISAERYWVTLAKRPSSERPAARVPSHPPKYNTASPHSRTSCLQSLVAQLRSARHSALAGGDTPSPGRVSPPAP